MEPPIQIRRVRRGDVKPLYDAVMESYNEISPWMSWLDETYSLKDARKWVLGCPRSWQENQAYAFVITDAEDRFLGTVGLNAIEFISRRANLGYWVRTSATGQGVASAAGRLLIEQAFSDTPPFPAELHRLEILVALGNEPSHRVAQKLGGIREGILRARLWPAGAPQDAVMYSVLRTDTR